jgi:long-chain acyl-CoA synthetase
MERLLEAFDCHLTQMYGLTETGGMIAALQHDEHHGERMSSCGRATFGTEIRIVDDEGAVVADGMPGELVTRGTGNTPGYWRKPDETAQLYRDGWLRTGDMALKDEDGFIYIRDRLKDMIISGGENVYPAEIESVLSQNSRVADVAVIGSSDPRWGEVPMAVVVPRAGDVTEAELIDWARNRLAGFKLPRSVVFVEEIPRTATGKILKRQLRTDYSNDDV